MYTISENLKALGENVLKKFPEFKRLEELYSKKVFKVAFLECDKPKHSKSKVIFAECSKLGEREKVLSGYDFAVTFYEDGSYMSCEKQEILMRHELKHIGFDDGKCFIVPHDVDEFSDIIKEYGVNWAEGT